MATLRFAVFSSPPMGTSKMVSDDGCSSRRLLHCARENPRERATPRALSSFSLAMTRNDLLRKAGEKRQRAQRIRQLAVDLSREADKATLAQLADEKEREASRLEKKAQRNANSAPKTRRASGKP